MIFTRLAGHFAKLTVDGRTYARVHATCSGWVGTVDFKKWQSFDSEDDACAWLKMHLPGAVMAELST